MLRARDHLHDRHVALKVRAVGADRERILSEARILLGLKPHPGVPLVREDLARALGASVEGSAR